MDIIDCETVFLKEGMIGDWWFGHASGASKAWEAPLPLTVRQPAAAAAAAAGLRMLDRVRSPNVRSLLG
jgi:hypothetical protein